MLDMLIPDAQAPQILKNLWREIANRAAAEGKINPDGRTIGLPTPLSKDEKSAVAY